MEADVTHAAAEAPRGVEGAPRVVGQAGWRRVVVWVARHELWMVVVLSPLMLFPERFPKAWLVAGLVLLVLLWPLRRLAWGYVTRRTPFDVLVVALMLMLPASLYASADFQTSLPKLTGILLGAAVFWAVVNTVTTPEHVTQLVGLMILVALGVVAVSLIGTEWGGEKLPFVPKVSQLLPTYRHDLTRTGLFHRNQVGGTLILFIPLNLALLVAALSGTTDANHRHKASSVVQRLQNHRYVVTALLALALLLMTGTLVLTQSRSALLGLGVALLFLLGLRNRWAMIAFVALVVLVLAGVWWIGPTEVGQSLLDVANGESPVGTLNFAGRQEVWSRAVYMLQDFPYTGVGLGMFDQVARVLYPFFLVGPDADVVHAHNVYLQVGVDLGLPGLVAYIGLISAFCMATWRAGRRASTPYVRAVALGLLGGMVAYHVYGLTDAMTLGAKPGAALWAMFGLAVVLNHQAGQKRPLSLEKHENGQATT